MSCMFTSCSGVFVCYPAQVIHSQQWSMADDRGHVVLRDQSRFCSQRGHLITIMQQKVSRLRMKDSRFAPSQFWLSWLTWKHSICLRETSDVRREVFTFFRLKLIRTYLLCSDISSEQPTLHTFDLLHHIEILLFALITIFTALSKKRRSWVCFCTLVKYFCFVRLCTLTHSIFTICLCFSHRYLFYSHIEYFYFRHKFYNILLLISCLFTFPEV